MAGKKKAAPKTDAPKADAPQPEAPKAKSPVITTDSVKESVYRVDLGESIP